MAHIEIEFAAYLSPVAELANCLQTLYEITLPIQSWPFIAKLIKDGHTPRELFHAFRLFPQAMATQTPEEFSKFIEAKLPLAVEFLRTADRSLSASELWLRWELLCDGTLPNLAAFEELGWKSAILAFSASEHQKPTYLN
jgi:hypothetical protein